MAFSVHQGSFTAKTSTGSQAYTGVGFTPKALIMWISNVTAAGYLPDASLGFGASDGTTDRGAAMWVDDNVGTDDSANRHDTKSLLLITSGTSTVGLAASVTSFDSDGFTLNYSTADGTGYLVNYIALGGTTLTNAKVGAAAAKLSTGNQAYTGVGFQPTCLLFFGVQLETAIPNNSVNGKLMIGAADGTHNAVTWFRDFDGGATSNTLSRLQTTSCITGTSSSSATLVSEASLTSFDADGFTLNWSTAGAAAFNYMYLALKGGSYFVGNDTQNTTTGTKATTGVGFRPAGLLAMGIQQATPNSFSGAQLAVGGTDGTRQGFTWAESQNGLGTSEANSAFGTTKALRFATGPSTTVAEAGISSMDSDGFTLNWSTADATARQFAFLAFGPAVIPANSVAPAVTGTATVGQVLSTTDGTWTGDATITFTYQWQRAGVDIGSATANTYTLVSADAGSAVRCVVTGTNGYGSATANSNATAAVAAAASTSTTNSIIPSTHHRARNAPTVALAPAAHTIIPNHTI